MHNILITGGEHADRINFAKEYAQVKLCLVQGLAPCRACINCQRVSSHTHPNLLWVSPKASDQEDNSQGDQNSFEGLGIIKIEQIRRIVIESHKANFEEGPGFFIITHMHKATISAANALLKIIEENQPHKIFIALAPSRASVLPTIASRLTCCPLRPTTFQHSPEDENNRQLIIKISTMAKKERIELCAQFSTERDALMMEFDGLGHTCHIMLRNNLVSPRLALGILEGLSKAKIELKKNLNPRLVTEQLILWQWPMRQSS